MKQTRVRKDGNKEYRVKEKAILAEGSECTVKYFVVNQKSIYRPPKKDPCGTLDECWNEELQDWYP